MKRNSLKTTQRQNIYDAFRLELAAGVRKRLLSKQRTLSSAQMPF